jgi:hypothetical protein
MASNEMDELKYRPYHRYIRLGETVLALLDSNDNNRLEFVQRQVLMLDVLSAAGRGYTAANTVLIITLPHIIGSAPIGEWTCDTVCWEDLHPLRMGAMNQYLSTKQN